MKHGTRNPKDRAVANCDELQTSAGRCTEPAPEARCAYAHAYVTPYNSDNKERSFAGLLGGPCRIRTCDLGIKSPLLYQLS